MSDAKLYTLTEIADKIGVNYKTLFNYKDAFRDYLVIENQGRQIRYPPVNIQIFSKILELKDEGLSNEQVAEILVDWKSQNPEIFPSFSPSVCPSFSRSFLPSIDPSLFPSVFLDVLPSVDLKSGKNNTEPEKNEIDMEKIISKIKEEVERNLKDMERITADKIQSTLSDLTPQINAAFTQFYKAVTELQEEHKDLHARLAHLEKELGTHPAANPVLVELDLERMQISLQAEKPAPQMQHATIDFVKASISDGKPDKQSVVQWIQAERERSPDLSYTDLAEMLDAAGVPTLRGGTGWNRGTIRNISVK